MIPRIRRRVPTAHRILTLGLSVAVTATVVASTPPAFAAAGRAAAPPIQHDAVVAGHDVGAIATPASKVKISAVKDYAAAAPTWPGTTASDITLNTAPSGTSTTAATGTASSASPTARSVGTEVRAGAAPVWLAPVTGSAAAKAAASTNGTAAAASQTIHVHVYDHSATTHAGVNGLLLTLARADGGAAAPDQIRVDYSAIRGAFGADWASRLKLVELTGCTTLTPVPAGCQRVELPTSNDSVNGLLTAVVTPPVTGGVATSKASAAATTSSAGRPMVLAATADTGGGSGSFGATTLSPSGSWSVGGSTGDFQWSYPLRTPPGVGGPAPKLALSYDSGAVDGEQSATNNQPSWVGEGFDLSSGYIERSYTSCSLADDSGANNAGNPTGDECWLSDNATLSLGGHSGELIKDASNPNRWHLRNDDGTFVEHLTGAANGAQNGEYWRVTTSDGSQFFFGSTPSANSTWTEPVYGNKSGEPCYQSTFSASSCTQAWRWTLDKAVDTSGNSMTYKYTTESNQYGAAGDPNHLASYIRAGYLNEIDYGTNGSSSAPAPVRVLFSTGPRCITSSCSTHDATNWPDTPWDQQCTSAPCYTGGPTFWSDVMLNSIRTQLYSGTGTTYNDVTAWTLGHKFPDPGDGTRAGLWLNSIQETGYDGGTSATLPPVTFTPVQMANRVEAVNGLAPMNWMRIAQITTESGEQVQVTYSGPDCTAGSRMPDPNNLQNNTYRCYPVITPASGSTPASTDYFHKYVVAQVNVADLTTPGNPTTTTAYTYNSTPAWHYTDDIGITPKAAKTWSVWRGYGDVTTTQGVGADAASSETLYFRGMNGDHMPSGTRSAILPAVDLNGNGSTGDSVDAPVAADDDPLSGMTRQTISRNGSALVATSVNQPWESAPTATVTANGVTVNAVMTGISDTRSETVLDGGRAPRTTSTHTDFDPTYGTPIDSQNNGDDAVSGDENCSLTTYDRATSSDGSTWITGLPSRVQSFATTCATAQAGNLTAAQVVSDTLTYYDNATSATTPPTRGLSTRVDTMKDWVGGAPVYMTASQTRYDTVGRIVGATDARGNTTTTAYTVNAAGQQTGTSQSNVLGWTTSTTVDPATGQPLTSTDPNGRVTAESYDALGRLASVWNPGRDQASQSANTTYAYLVRANAPTVVTTSTLAPSGGYVTGYALYDGMLRLRQTQASRGDGTAGALISDTLYDTAGRAKTTYSPYLASVTPGTALFVANQQSDVPRYTVTSFDGAGRPASSSVWINTTGTPAVFATTTTAYGGDRVDVTPPSGVGTSSTITDARGNKVALLQYHGTTPTPTDPLSYDKTTYTYNAKDQLTQVSDPAGNNWTTAYDVRGRVAGTVDPDTGASTNSYDDAGDVISTTDARGVTLDFTYDQIGRETGVYQGTIAPANQLTSFTYDGIANSRGQQTSSTSYDGGNAYTTSVLGLTAGYQPTAVSYKIPTSETGLAGTYTYTYTYNVDGSPNTVRIPSVDGGAMQTETLTSGYTALGKAMSLSTSIPTATTLVPSIAYTGYGEVAQTTLQTNGGSTVWLTDAYAAGTRTLAEQTVSRQVGTPTVADSHYTYDNTGRPTEISESVAGDNQCFAYDYLDRLTSAWTPGSGDCSAAKSAATLGGPAPYWTDWSYDSAGTRIGQTSHLATGNQTTTYTVPTPGAAQPHTATASSMTGGSGTQNAAYHYDAAGDTTSRPSPNGPASQTITWNALGHVASVSDNGQTTSYTYDTGGSRLVERDGTGRTLYLPGQELRYTAATGTKATTRYYALGGQTIAMRTASGLTWLAGDYQGTTNVTIDAATQSASVRRQDPWGNTRTATGTSPAALDRGFVGGTVDATGLTHLGAREYDPALGRFLSVDPVMEKGVPQRFDGYAYASDNPVRSSDPAGTDPPSGPPSGAPPCPTSSCGYEYVGSQRYYYDADGYRIYFTLDWYAWCTSDGKQCLDVVDKKTGKDYGLAVYTDGIGYDVVVERLAPPPPPQCTLIPPTYIGAATGSIGPADGGGGPGLAGSLVESGLMIAGCLAFAEIIGPLCLAAGALGAFNSGSRLLSGADAGDGLATAADLAGVVGPFAGLDGLGEGIDTSSDYVPIYKAPQPGVSGEQWLAQGFNPADFPGERFEIPDGAAYFAKDKPLGVMYAKQYNTGLLEIRIPSLDYDTYYKQYEDEYDNTGLIQVIVPNTDFGRLNSYPRYWTPYAP